MSHLTVFCTLFLAFWARAEPAQQQFSDWLATCNNLGECQARNVGRHRGLVLEVHESHNALQLRFSQRVLPAQIDGHLLLDDQPLVLDSGWQWDGAGGVSDDPMVIHELIIRLKQGHLITMTSGPGRISLVGFAQAMDFISHHKAVSPVVQASDVSEVSTVTPLTEQERNTLQEYVSWWEADNGCSLSPSSRQTRLFALSHDKVLLIVGCEAGAWNVVDRLWLIDRNSPWSRRPLNLILPFTYRQKTHMSEVMNAEYDEQHQRLTTQNRWRGLGDCGVATIWRFDGQHFLLQRYAASPVCDGWHRINDWPTLWDMTRRSDVLPAQQYQVAG